MKREAYSVITGIILTTLICMSHGEPGPLGSDSANAVEALIDSLEEATNASIKDQKSSPVSFSGEGRLKFQYHDIRNPPSYMREDRSWLQSNWEGNEGLLRIGMRVNPWSNLSINTQIGFQGTFPGFYINPDSTRSDGNNLGFKAKQGIHDKNNEPAYIHDDLKADIALRTPVAAFSLKLGGIQWIEMSPFTVWKYQRRMFAWDYLPFEIEEPIMAYYDKNMVKGERSGRAAWNKKPFNGIGLESIEFPWGLNFNFFYGLYERYDSGEREFVDFSNDLAYANYPYDAKSRGIGDSYHHVLQFSLAKKDIFRGLTAGLNAVGYQVDKTIENDQIFKDVFWNNTPAFYKEPKIFTFDLKGTITNRMEMQTEVALGFVDTTFIRYDSIGVKDWRPAQNNLNPAFFCHVKSAYGVQAALDAAYISSGFYSPNSFVAPTDVFFPFGSNLVGAGKFLSRGEGSPYAQNMAGAVLEISPKIENGHVKFKYGQHFQPHSARDVIFFPYRLNGQDFYGLTQSSYNRWGIDLLDVSLSGLYDKRLGDESYRKIYDKKPLGPEAGGIRQDYLGTFEGFVPYEDSAHAASNGKEFTTIFTRSPNVPRHRKYTFNVESDIAYDIGRLTGYSKAFYLSLYAAINGISTQAEPVAFSQKDQLLWSLFLRFEPALELSNTLYIIGIVGFENWKSDKVWMAQKSGVAAKPIDFRDYAAGVGFDWEAAARVGLHGRIKWMRHTDVNYRNNDWETPLVSTEIKMWF
jgi:hypothetical protein